MGDRRLVVEHRPVQTSAVYVLRHSKAHAAPPPSPPSPPQELCESVEPLVIKRDGGSASEHNDRSAVRSADDSSVTAASRLQRAVHVLSTEARALASVANLYEADATARDGFDRAVGAIAALRGLGGKLVITGVGKSGHIANKLAATFSSLSVPAVFLNPLDALHGDLGVVGPRDTMMLITFSGRTTELLGLIPHLSHVSRLVLLTGQTKAEDCVLLKMRPDMILLPAPVLESEAVSFGVSAPTTSTTVALAVGDAVAIATAEELHASVAQVFARNHPGGAIGASLRRSKPDTIRDLSVPWADIPDVLGAHCHAYDVLEAGFDSTVKWVRAGDTVASPSRIRGLCGADAEVLSRRAADVDGLLVARHQMLSISAETSVRRAIDFAKAVEGVTTADDGGGAYGPDTVLAVLDQGEIVGVIEVRQLLDGEKA